MFLASDGVQCLTDDVIGSLEGVGTGKLSALPGACRRRRDVLSGLACQCISPAIHDRTPAADR